MTHVGQEEALGVGRQLRLPFRGHELILPPSEKRQVLQVTQRALAKGPAQGQGQEGHRHEENALGDERVERTSCEPGGGQRRAHQKARRPHRQTTGEGGSDDEKGRHDHDGGEAHITRAVDHRRQETDRQDGAQDSEAIQPPATEIVDTRDSLQQAVESQVREKEERAEERGERGSIGEDGEPRTRQDDRKRHMAIQVSIESPTEINGARFVLVRYRHDDS